MTPEYLAKLEAALTKDDWQFIEYAVATRIESASKLMPGEKLKPSKAFVEQSKRIQHFLQAKAFL